MSAGNSRGGSGEVSGGTSKPRKRWVVRPRSSGEPIAVSRPGEGEPVVTVVVDGDEVVVSTPGGAPVRYGRRDVFRLIQALRQAQATALWVAGEW